MAKRVRLLAFDTSASACSVALLDTSQPLQSQVTAAHQFMPMQQGRLILPFIQKVLDSFSITLRDLDAIAFGCGPGSFTGIRIASSVAQGIAFATNCKVIPISSLAAMAQTAYLDKKWTELLVAVDARVGEVYWAQYAVNSIGIVELIGKEQVCPPDKVPYLENQRLWHGIGEGWKKYGEIFSKRLGANLGLVDTDLHPKAEAILTLASMKLEKGEWIEGSHAFPVYLR